MSCSCSNLQRHLEALSERTRITLGAPHDAFGRFKVGIAAEVSSKPLCGARALLTFQAFKHNAEWIDKFVGEAVPQENGFMQTTRNEPLGMTTGIVPWNSHMASMALKAVLALVMGNCFILKPFKTTPFAAPALGPLIKEVGFFRCLSNPLWR